jgi:CheY-like chemotaxis protein
MEKKKIVVADDEVHIIHVVALKFRKNDYEVFTAGTGTEAFELVRDERPDILITDYQMPGMNGIEVVKKIRENEQLKDLPVIMLTARNFEMEEEQKSKLNISEFIGKPFSPRELLSKVEQVLEKSKVMASN